MSFIQFLNPFYWRNQYNQLALEHTQLKLDFKEVEEKLADYQFDELVANHKDEVDEYEERHFTRYHSPCSCGGTIMPMYYEHPDLGTFCNRCG